ncbi:hypothetical protein, partial [Bacillus velezensis]|uniref:hypothetical protein n=1 Tax=Bacillus velezensis TaxID=492670 RepID=UPI001ABBA382
MTTIGDLWLLVLFLSFLCNCSQILASVIKAFKGLLLCKAKNGLLTLYCCGPCVPFPYKGRVFALFV